MSLHKKPYTVEFKLGALSLVLEETLSCTEVGRRSGVCCKNIFRRI